jgi:hypothetical protein
MSGAQNKKKNKVIKQCDYSSMTYCTVIRKLRYKLGKKKASGNFLRKAEKVLFYFFNFYLSYRVIIKLKKLKKKRNEFEFLS